MNEENNREDAPKDPEWLKGIIVLIFFIFIVGGCMAHGTNSNSNDFDWNDQDDVEGFMNYIDKNDKRDMNGYKVE